RGSERRLEGPRAVEHERGPHAVAEGRRQGLQAARCTHSGAAGSAGALSGHTCDSLRPRFAWPNAFPSVSPAARQQPADLTLDAQSLPVNHRQALQLVYVLRVRLCLEAMSAFGAKRTCRARRWRIDRSLMTPSGHQPHAFAAMQGPEPL